MEHQRRARVIREGGFSLIEVLIAVVVLSIGLAAVANLFAMATTSNVAARHMTAATTQATEAMETLKAVPFAGLVEGGDVELDGQAATNHQWDADEPIRVDLDGDDEIDTYEADREVDGVGPIWIRWQIAALDNQTRLIRVVAASRSPLLRARSRVELRTYRTCTGPNLGCPIAP